MSNALLALLVAIGSAGWIYSKMMKKSGGLTQNALIVSGVIGLFVFFVVLVIASMVL